MEFQASYFVTIVMIQRKSKINKEKNVNGFNEMFIYDLNACAVFSQHETASEKESARGDFKNVSKILSNVDDLLLPFYICISFVTARQSFFLLFSICLFFNRNFWLHFLFCFALQRIAKRTDVVPNSDYLHKSKYL